MKRGKYEKVPAPTPSRYEKLKKRTLLQSYLLSLVSLCLCATMLMGTTMAWFTDDVTNEGNEIYTGILNVDLQCGENSLTNNPSHKVFDPSIYWEPDHVELRTLTVKNEGELPFNYYLSFTLPAVNIQSDDNSLEENDTALMDMFSVYVKEGAHTEATPSELHNGWENKGTLANVITNGVEIFSGSSNEMTDKMTTYTIAVYMHTDATREMMGKSLTFDIKLVASQLGMPETVKNHTELAETLKSGKGVVFTEGINLEANVTLSNGTLDGNNYVLNAIAAESNYDCAITTTGGTIKNLTITGQTNSTRAIGSGSSGTTTMTENLYIDNVKIDNVQYAINGHGDGTCKVVVTNSTINGWCSYANITNFEFMNCKLGKGNSYDGYMVVYGNTSFTNCEFTDFHMCADDTVVEGSTVSFTNCTYDGENITANNFKTLFMLTDDETDFNKLQKCTIIVDGKTVTW